MKYAFMSFSCPKADLGQMISLARQYGYDGIEPRTGGVHAHGVEATLSSAERRACLEIARDQGVAFATIAVGSRFADPETNRSCIDEAEAGIRLAHDLDCRIIRVFGGKIPLGDSREVAIERVTAALRHLGPIASDHGVTVCLETHDDWCDPTHVASVMQAVDHPSVGVNWDIMHPVRKHLASMEASYTLLRPWIKHVHIHDGTNNPDTLEFRAFGTGEYDLATVFRSLIADRYAGYLSGEWINWEAADLHLPREIQAMRAFEATFSTSTS